MKNIGIEELFEPLILVDIMLLQHDFEILDIYEMFEQQYMVIIIIIV
jgi:hypothetical protein